MAGGNVHLAAERLFGTTPTATALLTASIAQDPLALESLNAQLRTLTMLQVFDSMHEAKVLMPTVLQAMEPADFAKYYLKLVDNIQKLTEPTEAPSTPADALARVINLLPPIARRAFMTLVESGSTTTDPSLDAPSPLSEGEGTEPTSPAFVANADVGSSGVVGRHEADSGSADSSSSAVQWASSTETEGEAA